MLPLAGIGKSVPSPIGAALQQRSVTPALSAPGMSISISSRRSSPVVFADTHDDRAVHAGAGSGGGRSSAISRRIDLGEQHPWHGDLGHLEGDVAAVADQPGADLDQLLLRLVSDQSLIGSDVASVHRKLSRL